jgi:tRNA-specific 2-thiouridylase
MDVCFITRGGRRSFLSERIPARAGVLVDTHGATLGAHDGVSSFTIGQRRGHGVAMGERRYVVDVDARTATVTLGARHELLRESVTLRDVTFVDGSPAGRPGLSAQTRAHGTPIASSFDGTTVHFASAQPRVAPGQVVALYAGDALLGGGIAS